MSRLGWLVERAEAIPLAHLTSLHRATEGMQVDEHAARVLSDSGLAADSFNTVPVRVPFMQQDASALREALESFRA